jgi:bromodomain-containing protein 8
VDAKPTVWRVADYQSEASDYYDVIKRPMDLKKIRQRIKDGEISTIDEFERDILLLFAWVAGGVFVAGGRD